MTDDVATSLKDRVALVTGASRGIGYHAAIELARRGAHVIAVARTVGGLEELDDAIAGTGGSATLVPLNLKDFAGIDRLAETVAERWGKLDILFGNAGLLGTVTPLPHLSQQVFDDVMAVNVTANFRLIGAFDALLRKSDAGRALFVTSGAVRSNRPFVAAYAASKAALEGMIKGYASEVQQSSLRVNLFDPATVRTKMRARYAPGEDPQDVTPPEDLSSKIADLLSPHEQTNGGIYSFSAKDWLS